MVTETETEWETVGNELAQPLVLNEGDSFVGQYLGVDTVVTEEGEKFDYLLFREDGSDVVFNLSASWQLRRLFIEGDEIRPHTRIKLTRLSDIPSKVAGRNPMKNYRVALPKS